MRLPTVAAACLLALVPLRAAQAAPNRLDLLRQTVENRPEDGLTKAQIKTLAKVDKLLGKTPANTAGEVAAAISVVKLLDKAFPGDAQFAFVVDNAIPFVQGDVTADHDALATLLAELPDGKRRTKAQTALAAAETAVAGIATAGDRPTKLGLLKSAVASIGKGFNAVTKRQSYLIATLDDGSGPRRIAVTKLRLYVRNDPRGGAYQVYVAAYAARLKVVQLGLYPVSGTDSFTLASPPDDDFVGSAAAWIDYPAVYLTTDPEPGVATITRYDDRHAFDATFAFKATSKSATSVTFTDGVLRIR